MNSSAEILQANEFAVPEKMSFFKRIGNLIFNPKKLFAYIAKKPTILFPFIVLCIISFIVNLLSLEYFQGTFMDTLYYASKTAGGNLSVDQAESYAKGFSVALIALTPVVLIISCLIVASVLYLVFSLAGCNKGFKKYLSMVIYITVITELGSLVHGLYTYFTGDFQMTASVTSLASLINSENISSFIYGITKKIEVFNIWKYILYGIGFIHTGGVLKKRAYIISAALFVITTLISAAMGNLAGSML